MGNLLPGRFLCNRLTQAVLLFIYFWWRILIKGFQSTFQLFCGTNQRESWSAANHQRSSLIWPRKQTVWLRGMDNSENWGQQTWVSSHFAEKVWPNTVLLVSGSCFSNLSPLWLSEVQATGRPCLWTPHGSCHLKGSQAEAGVLLGNSPHSRMSAVGKTDPSLEHWHIWRWYPWELKPMAFYFRSCLSYVRKHDSGYPVFLLDPCLFPIGPEIVTLEHSLQVLTEFSPPSSSFTLFYSDLLQITFILKEFFF